MEISYPVTKDTYADQQQIGSNQMPLHDIVEPINNNDRRSRSWNSLKKVKNKFSDLSRSMYRRESGIAAIFIVIKYYPVLEKMLY